VFLGEGVDLRHVFGGGAPLSSESLAADVLALFW